MKNCSKCKQEISEDAEFCTACGHSQLEDPRIESGGILVLFYIVSVLSILDGAGIIIKGLNFFMDGYRIWYLLYAIAGIEMIIGLFIMVTQRKKYGLYVYSISQLVYIVAVIRTVFRHTVGALDTAIGPLVNVLALQFIILGLIYTLIFWLLSRKILK